MCHAPTQSATLVVATIGGTRTKAVVTDAEMKSARMAARMVVQTTCARIGVSVDESFCRVYVNSDIRNKIQDPQ